MIEANAALDVFESAAHSERCRREHRGIEVLEHGLPQELRHIDGSGLQGDNARS